MTLPQITAPTLIKIVSEQIDTPVHQIPVIKTHSEMMPRSEQPPDLYKLETRLEAMRKQHMEELKMQQSDFNLKLLQAQN
jgi:hypothetical protein